MSKVKQVTCEGCNEKYDSDTFDIESTAGNISNKLICGACIESEYERPSTLIKYERGEKSIVQWGDHLAWRQGEDADDSEPEKWFWNLLGKNRRAWKSTDAWRGYYETKFKGLVKLADGWVTGWVDETAKRKEAAINLHELLENGEILPAPLFWLFESTSNVFSTASEILCRPQDRKKLIKWLDKYGYTLENLQEAFC